MSNNLSGFHIIDDIDLDVEPPKKSYKGLTGFWSKWGGARSGVATNQWGDAGVDDEWFCQSCNAPQPPQLSPFRFEYPDREFIRVCAVCYAEQCIKLFERIKRTL